MTLTVRRAERKQKKFKGAVVGVSGSGKTWTALELATGLKNGGRILLLDTERSSSTLYADRFDFDVVDLPDSEVKTYLQGIDLAVKNGYDSLVIDSLSHAWEYLLEEVENVQKRDRRRNSFTAWAEVTPIYKTLVHKIVTVPIHVVATMRAKSEYVMEEYTDSKGHRREKPVKVGLAPVFRQGGEYEFDLVANIDLEHTLVVEKSRIDFLADKVMSKPTSDVGRQIRDWLESGKAEETPPQASEPEPTAGDDAEPQGTITVAQAKELTRLAELAGVPLAKVPRAAGVLELLEVPAVRFEELVAKLEAKVKAKDLAGAV
jgi:hypothetical protein